MQEVEWCAGELGEEEYKQSLYSGAELRPAWGGQVFKPRYDGTGYKLMHPDYECGCGERGWGGVRGMR